VSNRSPSSSGSGNTLAMLRFVSNAVVKDDSPSVSTCCMPSSASLRASETGLRERGCSRGCSDPIGSLSSRGTSDTVSTNSTTEVPNGGPAEGLNASPGLVGAAIVNNGTVRSSCCSFGEWPLKAGVSFVGCRAIPVTRASFLSTKYRLPHPVTLWMLLWRRIGGVPLRACFRVAGSLAVMCNRPRPLEETASCELFLLKVRVGACGRAVWWPWLTPTHCRSRMLLRQTALRPQRPASRNHLTLLVIFASMTVRVTLTVIG
jgi:hypothetical protein